MTEAPPTPSLAGIRAHHLFAGLSPEQMQRMLASSQIIAADRGRCCSIAASPPGTSTSSSKVR
jgi:hypothetical protein